MGNVPLTVTVSAAVHAVAVLIVSTQDIEIDHARVAPTTITTVELVPPAPATAPGLDVELAPAPAPTSTPASRASIATSRPGTRPGIQPGTEPGTDQPGTTRPGTTRTLDMRKGARADLFSLPRSRDDLDHVPAGTGPEQPPSSGKLAPNGTGYKTDEGAYVAKVDKDGRVKMEDRPDVSIGWAVPSPKLIGRGIAEWFESDKGPDGKRGKRTLEHEVSGSVDKPTAGCEGVRDPACSPDRSTTVVVPVARGGFNPTDWIMRRTVGDPYASKKRAYLDATRDERAQIRASHRSEQLSETAMIMRKNLERAWASTNDMAVRKQLLFELWDEIVEPADEDSELAAASRTARAQVIGFIRARLPQGSTHAYRSDEITALAAKKQSIETFSPYE